MEKWQEEYTIIDYRHDHIAIITRAYPYREAKGCYSVWHTFGNNPAELADLNNYFFDHADEGETTSCDTFSEALVDAIYNY